MQYLQQFHKISQIFKHAADNVENVIVFLINHTDIHIIQYLTDKKHTPLYQATVSLKITPMINRKSYTVKV